MISITGLGIVCAIGNDTHSVLDSLRKKKSGIGTMKYLNSKHKELPVGEVKLSSDEMKKMLGIQDDKPVSRTVLMGAIAIREALAQAGIKDTRGKRVAVISGTSVGGMDITEQYFERMKTDDSLLYVSHENGCGTISQKMADLAGLGEAKVCTISTACSAALNSIMLGAEMLKNNEVDLVVAGGSEALCAFNLNGFNTLMIIDKERCRPFDATRAGLNLGEGAGFVVLEKDAPNSLAYVTGYGNRCDAYHQTATSENGEGAYLAMTDALSMAQLQPRDIQYVNAHGTGTPDNDISESRALRRVFGDEMPEISSTKSFTGHTTSASGAIETVMCVLAMQHGFTPANLGWEQQIDGGILPTQGSDNIELNNILCNSFGFGGNDTSLVLSSAKCPDSQENNTFNQISAADVDATSVVKVISKCQITDMEELKGIKEYVSPMESRRMGKLMKAAYLTSLRALQEAGIERPDAIISATSRGMQEGSEKFLEDIIEHGEELLKPTLFMQSTHNTLSSAIAILTKCHGYNMTYSQGEESLDWALLDAERRLRSGKAKYVLVGVFDESTPIWSSFMERSEKAIPLPLFAKSMVLTLCEENK